jgi:DNA-binding CsgD family transcriptional regulator
MTTRAEFLLPRSELLHTEYYNDYLRPQKVESGIGVTLIQDRTRMVALSLMCGARTIERQQPRIDLLQRLVPHVTRAIQINRQLDAADLRWQLAEASLERLSTAVVLLDEAGQALFLNKNADRILQESDGLRLDGGGRLRAVAAADDVRLARAVADALACVTGNATAAGGIVSVRRRSGKQAYNVLVSPLRLPVAAFQYMQRGVAVTIGDPHSALAGTGELLANMYRLTAGETRLTLRMAAGDSPKSAAAALDISYETARTVLKRIYSKVGVSRQGELVALFNRLRM